MRTPSHANEDNQQHLSSIPCSSLVRVRKDAFRSRPQPAPFYSSSGQYERIASCPSTPVPTGDLRHKLKFVSHCEPTSCWHRPRADCFQVQKSVHVHDFASILINVCAPFIQSLGASVLSVLCCSRLVEPLRAERATTCALLALTLTKAWVGRSGSHAYPTRSALPFVV